MEAERLEAEAKQREINDKRAGTTTGAGMSVGFEEPLEGGLTNTQDRRKHRTPMEKALLRGQRVRYAGEWFYGKRHGNGTLNGTDSSVYRGRFMHERHE